MRALVTGACGFVGDFLARHLLDCGDEVLASRLFESDQDYPYKTVLLDVADVEQCARLIRDYRPEVIYHLAGIAFVPEAENDFQKTLAINVGGTNSIFRICDMLDSNITVVFVSSAEVYGRIKPEDLPLDEVKAVQPAHNYSLSKAMAELLVHRYAQFRRLKGVIMRPFNHIGPGQDDRFVASSFAHQLAQIATNKIPAVIKVGNLSARRDFCDVRDVVKCYRLAAQKGQGIYNISSGKSFEIQSILDTLIEISDLDVKIERDAARRRPSEVPEIKGSYEKAQRELGWQPEIELRDSLKDIYRYWLEKEQ